MNDPIAAASFSSHRDGSAPAEGSEGAVRSSGKEKSAYVVVARRYRPQTFEELIGQQHVSQALARAIASQRVGHAYLFTGARGVGKTSAARILAKALNCAEGSSPTPCNQCELCLSVSSGDDIDVLEIDGASNRGIDEIRQLRQNVAVRPSRARYKIYIIDEVHMLTKEAFNALLKTLEEPPEHVKFIFATTEPNKIPITILSRCQRYDFAGIEAAAIQTRLEQIANAEGIAVDADALQILAMRAAGSMRDSQSLLEQLLSTGAESITAVNVTTMLGIAPATRLSQLVHPLVERDAAAALRELDAGIAEGAEVSQLVDQLLGYFRDVMTQTVGCDATSLLYALPSQIDEVRQVAEQLGVQTLLAIVQILDQTAARMRVSTQTRTLAEMAVVRICQLENLDELSTLIVQLREGGLAAPEPSGLKKNVIPKLPLAPVATPKSAAATSKSSSAVSTTTAAAAPATSTLPSPTSALAVGVQAASGTAERVPAGHAPAGNVPTGNVPAGNAAAGNAAAGNAAASETGEDQTTRRRPASPVPLPKEQPTPRAATPTASRLSSGKLSNGNVKEIWKQVLASLTGMVMDHAAEADQVSVDGQGRLLIRFRESFHRDVFERPANRSRLETALHDVCGTKIKFVLETHNRTDASGKPAVRALSRRQQQAEIAARPFVKRAMELFDGDPSRLRYIPPRKK